MFFHIQLIGNFLEHDIEALKVNLLKDLCWSLGLPLATNGQSRVQICLSQEDEFQFECVVKILPKLTSADKSEEELFSELQRQVIDASSLLRNGIVTQYATKENHLIRQGDRCETETEKKTAKDVFQIANESETEDIIEKLILLYENVCDGKLITAENAFYKLVRETPFVELLEKAGQKLKEAPAFPVGTLPLEYNPFIGQTYANEAMRLVGCRKDKEASSEFVTALRFYENDIVTLRQSGECFERLKEYVLAIRQFEICVILEKSRDDILSLAFCHYRNNQLEEAIKLYSELLELDQNDIAIRFNRGCLYYMMGKYEEARVDFQVIFFLSPKFHDSMPKRACEKKGFKAP